MRPGKRRRTRQRSWLVPGRCPLGRAAVSGLRQPIVAILLLIALFTTVVGKPLDGFLMLAVAILLTFDAARSRRQSAAGNPGTSLAAQPVASAPAEEPVAAAR
jgi:hypothetical protein